MYEPVSRRFWISFGLFALLGARALGAEIDTSQYAFTHLVGTFAGPGYTDGQGIGAKFNQPDAITFDSSGNAYIADTANSVIRKMDPSGNVTTLAGAPGQPGDVDGAGSAARFNAPNGVAVDSSGNVYVADTANNAVRKITSAGVVSTLVPGTTNFSSDGAAGTATAHAPLAVAVDSSGNVYFTEQYALRKIAPDGSVTTLAGDITRNTFDATKNFNDPHGIAIDSSGDVFVADTGSETILEVKPDKTVTVFAGAAGATGSTNSLGTAALFNSPWGIAIDKTGNLYVSDSANRTIREVASTQYVSLVAGVVLSAGTTDGTALSAQFIQPTGIAIDPNGNIFVTDSQANTIRKIDTSKNVTTVAGSVAVTGTSDGASVATAQVNYPRGIAVDPSGNIYIADTNSNTIRKITTTGGLLTFAGNPKGGTADGTGTEGLFFEPSALASDSAGNIYVSDLGNQLIRKITPAGVVSTVAGVPRTPGYVDTQGAYARFNYPQGLAVDSSGNIYVADSYNYVIRKIAPDRTVTTIAGNNVSGYADGPALSAEFSMPVGVAVDASGNLYVADAGTNELIRKIGTDGNVTTIAGTQGTTGTVDGVGTAAQFDNLTSIAIDSLGNLFVTEQANDVRKIYPDGRVVTIGGVGSQVGNTDGVGSAALFSDLNGVAVDAMGNIYLADTTNSSIRKGIALMDNDPAARLVNISTRSYVGTDANVMIAGFIIGGTVPKTVLIRASGPALTNFGVSNVLTDPTLEIHNGPTILASNDNWGDDPTSKAAVLSAQAATGAFGFADGSTDSALVLTLPPGGYTAQVVGKGSVGTALVEVYEVDSSSPSKLINVSTRSLVETGANVQIGGFVIAGHGSKRVLVRVSGPALSQYGVGNVLADPVLEIHDTHGVIATNDNWDPNLASTFQRLSINNWTIGSKDAALELSLNPGSYTAVVTGNGGTSGVALIEVFEE